MDEDDEKFNDPVGLAWPLRPLLGDHLDLLEERWNAQPRIRGLATGLEELDYLLGGLEPSTVTAIGGRPGSGKTSLALAIAAHVGTHQEQGVLYFSLQHSHHQLVERLVTREIGADLRQYRRGQLPEGQWTTLGGALERHSRSMLFIDESPSLTIDEVRCRANWMKERHGLALVVIDFLQLLTDYRHGRSARGEELERAIHGMKALAHDDGVPVIVLGQMRPGASGIGGFRDCPAIGDCDTVLSLGGCPPDLWGVEEDRLQVRRLKHRDTDRTMALVDMKGRVRG